MRNPSILYASGALCSFLFTLCLAAKPVTGDYTVFIEAENATDSSGFIAEGLPQAAGCSGERRLNLWRPEKPGSKGYFATYTVTVPKAGTYWPVVWAQGLDTRCSSPFVVQIGGKTVAFMTKTAKIAADTFRYGTAGIVEHSAGPVDLKAGKQTLTLKLTGRRPLEDKAYNLIFDVIGLAAFDPAQYGAKDPIKLAVDAGSDLGPFTPDTNMSQGGIGDVTDPEFWRSMAPMLKKIGVRRIRIDHLFDYYGIVGRDAKGNLTFTWDRFDRMLETLLASGAVPFLCVSYMPQAIAKDGTPYALPAKYEEWQQACEQLARHMTTKWKLSGLYYEIWNEPDGAGFLAGKMEDYFKLYQTASAGILAADPTAKMGGPATAASAWIPAFLKFVKTNRLKLDFVSWHYYNVSLEIQVYVTQIEWVKQTLRDHGFPPSVELAFSEWNINGNIVRANDAFYNAANAAATLRVFHDHRVGSYFFFPKDPAGKTEFHGWFGAITHTNKPKPVYNALDAYSRLKGRRMRITGEDGRVQGLAARDGTTLRVLVWYFDGSKGFGVKRTVSLTVAPMAGTVRCDRYLVDREHANGGKPLERTGSETITAAGELTLQTELENGAVELMELYLTKGNQ